MSRYPRHLWTNEERATAMQLFAAKANSTEIAAALGMKPEAVRAWVHHNCRIWREPKIIKYPRAAVPHAEIPLWYELGWQLAELGKETCVFEWRYTGKTRMPFHHFVKNVKAADHLEVAA